MPVSGTWGRAVPLVWRTIPTLVPLVVGTVFLIQSRTLHGPEAVYPAVLAAVLVGLSGLNLIREFLPRTEASVSEPEPGPAPEPASEPERNRLTVGRPVAVIALLVLTLVLVTPLGFFAAIPVLLLGALAVNGVRRPLPLIVGATAIWAVAYAAFGLLLNVPLPTGTWW